VVSFPLVKRYQLIISYDGTHYAGWQVQKTGLAIQPLIQKALQTALRHPVDLTGSGRTDAGVHALGQSAHFDTPIIFDSPRLLASLNALLPPDIRVYTIRPVPSTFHARYSAKSKIYHYLIHLDPVLDPHLRLYRHHHLGPCDLGKIRAALPHLQGTHDFTSFTNEPGKGSASRDPIRTLAIQLTQEPGGIRLTFEADGFLYKMVRNLTGILLDIGAGRISPNEIPLILAAKDRRKAGHAAPPHGLFLVQVNYANLPESFQTKESESLPLPKPSLKEDDAQDTQEREAQASL